MLRVICTFLFFVTVIQSTCNKIETANSNANLGSNSNNSRANNKYQIRIEPRTNFDGCWSSTNGNRLKLNNGVFRASYNSFEPVKYRRMQNLDRNGEVVYKSVNRPDFYYFDEIVTFKNMIDEDGDEVVLIDNYESESAMDQKKSDGRLQWYESDCNTTYP